MSTDNYKPWVPLKDIPHELHFVAQHHDVEGFRVLLEASDDAEGRVLRIAFRTPLAFRASDEGSRIRTWQLLDNQAVRDTRQALYTINDSSWLEWFQKESGGVHSNESIIHYAIHSSDDCFDILSCEPPQVAWMVGYQGV